jgi:hypothetical protein
MAVVDEEEDLQRRVKGVGGRHVGLVFWGRIWRGLGIRAGQDKDQLGYVG